MLKKNLKKVIDWNGVDKNEYLNAMIQSAQDSQPIKSLLKSALTSKINDRGTYMHGIDISYFYEGYVEYKTENL
jgi:cell filamentation protein